MRIPIPGGPGEEIIGLDGTSVVQLTHTFNVWQSGSGGCCRVGAGGGGCQREVAAGECVGKRGGVELKKFNTERATTDYPNYPQTYANNYYQYNNNNTFDPHFCLFIPFG